MRALVVGGSGYLGSAVVRALHGRGIDTVALSRSGRASAGRGLRGDVIARGLQLDRATAEQLRSSVTHVISCFGSVDLGADPRAATELHQAGTREVLRFAESCRELERVVHLSSVLVLGRARGRVTDELELGQSFRNWYEYGKYLAEREVRRSDELPWRVVRLGPIFGAGGDVPPDPARGLLAVVPLLLRGYPIHLADHGRFRCYAGEATTAGEVVARATLDAGEHDVWTWFDNGDPMLADVLSALCDAWGVLPRIVDAPALAPLMRATIRRLGAPRELLDYARPWADIDPAVLARLPVDLPRCPPGYVAATGRTLRQTKLALQAA